MHPSPASSRGVLWRLVLPLILLTGCRVPDTERPAPLFSLVPAERSGLDFANELQEQDAFNVLEYEYFYNGGGVAVGDVNNDGLPDLYFTANSGSDRLYLNKGGLVFEDITASSGFVEEPNWTTGVTMADVNDDGLLDIYVCRSGKVIEDRRRNALYINNGDLTFTERAAEYGLDDPSYSNQAAFFDFDRDGDLDMFLLNHSIERYFRFNVYFMKNQRDPLAGDKLYRNDGGRFVDISEQAGIIGNPLGFGLSAIVSDIDKDGWLDLYVANDYVEDDYLYLNNRDGTFREELRSWIAHTSYSSMGSDIADFNNDALPDIISLDMLAEDNRRQKLLKGPEDFHFYQNMRSNGYHEQYMRNMLQLNNGNGTFSEIGQLAGIATTDWSWAALFADLDRDGFKDLFVTNGYMRDYTNMDFLEFTMKEAFLEAQRQGTRVSANELVQQMPMSKLRNYVFRNDGHLRFEDRTVVWGLDHAGLSNGGAYADLDRDGDLDLVTNNINEPAYLYENLADRDSSSHYLEVRLEGPAGNRFGVGAKVELRGPSGELFYQELVVGRGYLSAVEPRLFFGLGALRSVDVSVTWPDQRGQTLRKVSVDRELVLSHVDATTVEETPATGPAPIFAFHPAARGLGFEHVEDPFVDFETQPLLPHMLSRFGPAMAHGDVNRDGLVDLYFGGAAGQPGALYLQQLDATFARGSGPDFERHASYEDVGAAFFDSDGDGDLDLYVVSGGNVDQRDRSIYQDRLYRNNGFGLLAFDEDALPEITSSGSVVRPNDFDGDGDQDLFVGGRVTPGRYPVSPRSHLLRNEGGRFVDVTSEVGEDLQEPGMVTDAIWANVDGDEGDELLLVGEWMPVRLFTYDSDKDRFVERSKRAGFEDTSGWWNTIIAADFDADGDLDLAAGNRGLNSLVRASRSEPATIVAADFDASGTIDPIVGYYIQGKPYPAPWRNELLAQIPRLAETFTTYETYAETTFDQVLGRLDREGAVRLEAQEFASCLFENTGGGVFRKIELPLRAQFSWINALLADDFDGDGRLDLLAAGNRFWIRTQWGRDDAGQGLLLSGDGQLGFTPRSWNESGFYAPGEVRGMAQVQTPYGPLIVLANNDGPVWVYSY